MHLHLSSFVWTTSWSGLSDRIYIRLECVSEGIYTWWFQDRIESDQKKRMKWPGVNSPKKGASKGSSQRCHRITIFGSTKKHSVKGSLKKHLFLTFYIWRTFFHHKEPLWNRKVLQMLKFFTEPFRQKRFFYGIVKHLYFKSVMLRLNDAHKWISHC